MKVFLSILLGLFLLCCSAHARFTHSKQYLAMEEEKQLTMEQNWVKKFSHVQANTYSGTPRNCQFVKPQIGFGAQVPTALTVCSVDNGAVCHQTRLFKCCENEQLRGREFKAGGHTLNLGSSKGVEVNFFYSGGGFGSRQPLSFCFTIDGSDGVCGDDLFGCSSNPTCGPSDDICEGNIVEGTCNPDPNPDNGGGCTCQRGYLAPNCCLCDFPDFYETSQSTCDKLCREKCAGAPTRFGCSSCQPGYQGTGCCDCAPGFTRVGDECVKEVCDGQCASGTFDPQSGCGQCQLGFAPPTCCKCQPPFVKVGRECHAPCPTNCQPGFFTEGSGCAAGRCRVGHQSPPLCCNCTEGYMQPFPGAPCTLIPPCRPDQRRENGVCVDICTGNTVFNPDTKECDVACGGNEDLIFLLDYSTSFRPRELRGIIGNLQLISNATDSRPNIRDAAIHYNIRASRISPTRRFTPSDYIYDYDATCKDTVDQLDNFAENRNIDNNRSFATESYSALNFVAREVPFTAGRRTSIVTITDGFSDAPDRISRIETEISSIKAKASAANARVRFFSIGVRAQNVPNTADIQEELKALADGVDRENNYIDYEQFTDNLLNLLVDANILCPSDRKSLSSASTSDALDAYIDCSNGGSSCGTSKLGISCSKAQGMSSGKKGTLMTEILAAVQSVFNDAFKTQ